METQTVVDLAVVVGFVNLVSLLLPNYVSTSQSKAVVALIGAVILVYLPIPAPISQVVDLLFGSSGVYKGLQVIGAVKK